MAANLTKLMLVIVAIQIVFYLTGTVDIQTPNEMYTLMINPEKWSGAGIITLLNNTLTLVGAGIIVIGSILPGKHELVVMSGLAMVFLSMGMALAELHGLIAKDAANIFPGFVGGGGEIIALLFISPIIVIYFMTIISFWRGQA